MGRGEEGGGKKEELGEQRLRRLAHGTTHIKIIVARVRRIN